MKKEDIIILIFIMVMVSFTIYLGKLKNNITFECPPAEDYREQQYNEIKILYDHDEALLRYGKKIDENTRMLPVEYSNF